MLLIEQHPVVVLLFLSIQRTICVHFHSSGSSSYLRYVELSTVCRQSVSCVQKPPCTPSQAVEAGRQGLAMDNALLSLLFSSLVLGIDHLV
ncbi:hypothetical protein DFH27DRAFT_559028 [Peziza echinospora]|nr:hypothetical protein DFH27DRAFT_559028 [Peziza echinospora]